jgi:hypothetical protein
MAASSGVHGGGSVQREKHGEQRESGQGGREKKGGFFVASIDFSRGLLGGLGGKQEVATAGTWEPPRRCSRCPSEEDKNTFAKSPLALQVFSRKAKQHPFV